jgi:hypothetical protein
MAQCPQCGKPVSMFDADLSTGLCPTCFRSPAKPSVPSEGTLRAEGHNGQIEVTDTVVRIKRAGMLGFLTQGLKGDKEILISQISSVQFKNAGPFFNGYIQFAFLGGRENLGGLEAAVSDENTVMFRQGQQPVFEKIRDVVMQRVTAARAPAPQLSQADEISKLADLVDRKLLSPEEFHAAKRKILGI